MPKRQPTESAQPRLPKPLVVAICALILSLPAALAAGAFSPDASYRTTSAGKVKHRHDDGFPVKINSMSSFGDLRPRLVDMLEQFNDELDERTQITAPEVATAGEAAIRYETANLPSSQVVPVTNIGWHAQGLTDITYNTDHVNGMSGVEQRHRGCRALGMVLGLAPKPWQTDCMDNDGDPHSERFTFAGSNAQRLDNFYGPNISAAGTLKDNKSKIKRSGTYNLTVTVEAHALQSTSLVVWPLDTGPVAPPALFVPDSDTVNCPDNDNTCTGTLQLNSATLGLPDLPPGRYAVQVWSRGTYETGFISNAQQLFEIWVDYPYFGFNDTWAHPTWTNDRVDQTHQNNAYSELIQSGANTARFNLEMGLNSDCNATPGSPEGVDWTQRHVDAYTRMINAGIRPILVLIDTAVGCDPEVIPGQPPQQAGGCAPNQSHWTDKTPPAYPPADTEDNRLRWKEFARQAALEFPEALGIQVWNEANWSKFWGGCDPDPARYRQLVDWTRQGIRSLPTGQQLPIVLAGMTPIGNPGGSVVTNWIAFLNQLSAGFANDISDWSDITALHPYQIDCQTPAQNLETQIALAETLLSGTPETLWVTEIGVSTTGDPNLGNDCREYSEGEQASHLAAIHARLRLDAIDVAVFHSLADFPADPDDYAEGFGIYGARDDSGPGSFTGGRLLLGAKQGRCTLLAERGYC